HHPVTRPTDTLSLHDALPICTEALRAGFLCAPEATCASNQASAVARVKSAPSGEAAKRLSRGSRSADGSSRCSASAYSAPPSERDRKSTRLNSSHVSISYAVV